MATTLRIEECLYREAKAEAARQGMTITRFIEEALRLRLQHATIARHAGAVSLPTFACAAGFPYSPDALKSLVRQAEAAADDEEIAAAHVPG